MVWDLAPPGDIPLRGPRGKFSIYTYQRKNKFILREPFNHYARDCLFTEVRQLSEVNSIPDIEYPKLDDYDPYDYDSNGKGKLNNFKLQTGLSDYLRKSFMVYDDTLNCFYQWNFANRDPIYLELTESEVNYVIIEFLDHFGIATKKGLILDLILKLKKSLLLWKNNPILLMKNKQIFEEDGEVTEICPEEQLSNYDCYIHDPRAPELNNVYPLFAFNNGLFNFTTGELLPFTPYIFITDRQRIYCDWKEGTNHELGQRLLSGLFHDQETMNTFLDMLAYSVYRTPYDYVQPYIWILYGVGNTGKSRTLDIAEKLLGPKGYTNPDWLDLCGTFGKECLIGKRLSVCNEASDNFVESNWLKQFVEGTTSKKIFTIQRKHKPSLETTLNCSFIISTNNLIKIGSDTGMKRRVRVLPYNISQIPKEEDWRKLLRDESFYTWIADILYQRWMGIQSRLGHIEECPEVVKATSEYMRKQSTVEEFCHDLLIEESSNNTIRLPSSFNDNLPDDDPETIADMITGNPRYRDRAELYRIYTEYCRTWGRIPHTAQTFNDEVESKYGLTVKKSGNNRNWIRKG